MLLTDHVSCFQVGIAEDAWQFSSASSNSHVVVGRRFSEIDGYYWSGKLDELAVWDDILTKEQIMMIYMNGRD